MRSRRLTACALACAVALAVTSAVAAADSDGDDAVLRADKMAYDSAIKCFIANGIVAGDWHRDGNSAKQLASEAKARESFDLATRAGETLGYSGTRMNEDFGLAQTAELPRMMTDVAYFKRTAATCKALGLM